MSQAMLLSSRLHRRSALSSLVVVAMVDAATAEPAWPRGLELCALTLATAVRFLLESWVRLGETQRRRVGDPSVCAVLVCLACRRQCLEAGPLGFSVPNGAALTMQHQVAEIKRKKNQCLWPSR